MPELSPNPVLKLARDGVAIGVAQSAQFSEKQLWWDPEHLVWPVHVSRLMLHGPSAGGPLQPNTLYALYVDDVLAADKLLFARDHCGTMIHEDGTIIYELVEFAATVRPAFLEKQDVRVPPDPEGDRVLRAHGAEDRECSDKDR